MKKLLYLTVWNFVDEKSNGICKKILSQVKALEKYGFDVDFGYTINGKVYIRSKTNEMYLGKVPVALNIFMAYNLFAKFAENNQYDAAYIRHSAASPFYVNMLAVLRKHVNKIVVEFPTFPYDKELTGNIKLKLGGMVDRLSRGAMHKYIDKAITYSEHDSIFNIPTIKTINGIDCASIQQVKKKHESYEINLIAVAMLSTWHGFDRVIKGLNEYYQEDRVDVVRFHIVGSGNELGNYKSMVTQYGLEKYVQFYGNQSGKELDDIYEKADIAVSSLGLHRIGLASASTLKDREYGARGLAIITSHKIDYLPDDYPYFLMIPADETPVNILSVVSFYKNLLLENADEMSDRIRKTTVDNADIYVTFKPINEFLQEV